MGVKDRVLDAFELCCIFGAYFICGVKPKRKLFEFEKERQMHRLYATGLVPKPRMADDGTVIMPKVLKYASRRNHCYPNNRVTPTAIGVRVAAEDGKYPMAKLLRENIKSETSAAV